MSRNEIFSRRTPLQPTFFITLQHAAQLTQPPRGSDLSDHVSSSFGLGDPAVRRAGPSWDRWRASGSKWPRSWGRLSRSGSFCKRRQSTAGNRLETEARERTSCLLTAWREMCQAWKQFWCPPSFPFERQLWGSSLREGRAPETLWTARWEFPTTAAAQIRLEKRNDVSKRNQLCANPTSLFVRRNRSLSDKGWIFAGKQVTVQTQVSSLWVPKSLQWQLSHAALINGHKRTPTQTFPRDWRTQQQTR